jgi:Zn-finger nucleic acid-binding protein
MMIMLLRRVLTNDYSYCILCRGRWTDRGTNMEMAFWGHKIWCPLVTHRHQENE